MCLQSQAEVGQCHHSSVLLSEPLHYSRIGIQQCIAWYKPSLGVICECDAQCIVVTASGHVKLVYIFILPYTFVAILFCQSCTVPTVP